MLHITEAPSIAWQPRHQDIELKHAVGGFSFAAYAEREKLYLGHVIRDGIRNPGGWEFYPTNPTRPMVTAATQDGILRSVQAHLTERANRPGTVADDLQ